MKVLALDYGSKRIGLALGDTSLNIASPLGVFENREGVVEKIRNLISEYRVSLLIVGLPLTPRGQKGQRAKEVEEFVKKLRESLPEEIELLMWDERYTTKEAYWLLQDLPPTKRKKLKDSLSAYIILKEYLESL
ncbi:Holliday junction resolvase YqgF [Hydrogenobacter thermophilus TK-6]|uniref:Putative pre-16S rRNA nuclease n=1 Tax=Hydrogenobacter thermophilus (strain DSM 6534 / IAM 12695 / TK-6) TaxID=608538 RepID=D3DGJ1_HYDTT|nr:Holliday junction resolvase RuvX [Hydrogenobacter thermophilus]ADO44878.1 Holliday junction resolvase YqgF [Hydrogenobacter thermophilus TK-6]BAI68943.1 Holliday junction resolvase [Hydrogenobacter thermophilus TK-6]